MCPKCILVRYPRRIRLDDGCFSRFGGNLSFEFFLQAGPLQDKAGGKGDLSDNLNATAWRGAHIQLLLAIRMVDAIVVLYIIVIVRSAILFAGSWIIQVTMPVSPIFSVRNAFWCTILGTLDWMTVDSPNMADIQFLSSSSREVLCRQSWWQRWSFWQFKCSHTIMLEEWIGCLDDLFRVWNVSYGGHLLVLSVWILLCNT